MAHYRVVYMKQGSLDDGEVSDTRDVHEYTVQVERDGRFRGEWVGTIEGQTLYAMAGNDVSQFHRNAVPVVANHVWSAVHNGETLSDDVGRVVVLGGDEVMGLAPLCDTDWQPGDTVLEFDA